MKPSKFHRFLSAMAVLPTAITLSFAQEEPLPPIYHGYMKVDQLNADNNGLDTPNPSVATTIVRKAGPAETTTADRGDFGITFGQDKVWENGVLLSAVRENGRNNADGGDPNLTVFSTSSTWSTSTGQAIISGHSIANLAGTLYADYDGGTGPSFDGGVAGNTFVNTARPVAGFRPLLYTGTTVALGQSHTANVTALLKDWTRGGQQNNGLVVQTLRVGQSNAHTTDGWQVGTSSHGTIEYRPKLSVEYIPNSPGAKLLEFQNGLNGYNSTVNSVLFTPTATGTQPEKTVDGSTVEFDWIDLDGTSANFNQQSLVRFDDIIGSDKIESGSKVARAYLVITTNSSGNSQTNGPAVVREVLKPWDATTLSSGFSPEGPTEASGSVSAPLSSVSAIGAYSEAWFDVTSSVQSWADGSVNHGFHVSCTTDGWMVFFTGAPLPTVRPRLVVVTTPANQEITPVTKTFQNGVDGYTGTVDRSVSSTASENLDGSAVRQYFMDGWNGTDSPQQANLMRFENLIGTEANQIPADAFVLKADLTLTSGSSSNAQSGGSFAVARLLEPFETQSGSTYSSEWNVDMAYAYFPFSEGWVGGLATNHAFLNSGELVGNVLINGDYALDANGARISSNNRQLVTLIGSEGLTIGDETSLTANFVDYVAGVHPTNNGYYQLFLDDVNAMTDGILLVGGGRNEGNYAMSRPVDFDGVTAFEIVCHDNRTNGAGGENDCVNFVYIPRTAVAEGKVKALGRVMGDGATPIKEGDFTITEVSTGRWLLKIEGASDSQGTLIISPEGRGIITTLDEFGNEVTRQLYNNDNIVNYQWDAELGGWIVEGRDLPGASLQNADAQEGFFNFAYMEYPVVPVADNYQAWLDEHQLVGEDADHFADSDGDGFKNFAEFAFGLNPKSADSGSATQVSTTGEGAEKQLSITFLRRTDVAAQYQYLVEYSTDMVEWATSPTAVESVAPADAPLHEKVTVSDLINPEVGARFVRVRLVYTP